MTRTPTRLDAIFEDLAGISRRVQVAVKDATEALMTGDSSIAERVISEDAEIDRARERVEDNAFGLLSLQQPVAGDLRTIVAALRMVAELERMGDLSVHVAKVARLRVPDVAVPEEIRPTVQRMATVAEDMVARVTQVIAGRDVEAAIALGRDDEEMDQAASYQLHRVCSPTTGATASRRPSTSRCSVATTSGSPTTRSPSPTG
ncbi:PhoU domain-containing protein [Nocardioides convexus]|uniref:phosphate signaling complex PhoU family protein n=1 Tax=Nocardioides convexus TaxID=2712224 RepID=UPI003101B01A